MAQLALSSTAASFPSISGPSDGPCFIPPSPPPALFISLALAINQQTGDPSKRALQVAGSCQRLQWAFLRGLSHFVYMGAVETLAYLSFLYHPVILLAAPALSVDTSQVLLLFCWPCLLISDLR